MSDSIDVAPWEQPVDAAVPLDRLVDRLNLHVALDTCVADTFSLYSLQTHCVEIATHAPRLFLRSATKRCGKTTAIKVMARVVRRPEIISEVTRSSLFHTINDEGRCLLLDEADQSVAGHRPLFTVLNSGHDRDGAYIKQMHLGRNTRFCTFAFIIFGCIGDLHSTLMDRCIVAEMQRDTEHHARFRPERAPELHDIARQFRKWVDDNAALLAAYDPVLPDLGGNDRAQDNWRLMIGIADIAGGDWPHRARAAAVHLSGRGEPEVSEPEALIQDIYVIWGGNPPKVRSTELAAKLRDMEGRPWPTLTADRMAKILKAFPNGRGGQIKPEQLRFGHDNWHGYESWQFANAFSRYARPVAPVAPVASQTMTWQTMGWPSLAEIAAAVEAVRAEIASKKPPDEEIAAPVPPPPTPPTPPAPAAVEAEPGARATGATATTPPEPVAPEPVVEPKPSGLTPEIDAKIMESMAEKDPESYAELMKEAQAKVAAPTSEPAEAAKPTEAKVEREAGEPVPVEPTKKKNPRGRQPGKPLHPKICDHWLYGRDGHGMIVKADSTSAVRWFTRSFNPTNAKPEGDWCTEGDGYATLAAAKKAIS